MTPHLGQARLGQGKEIAEVFSFSYTPPFALNFTSSGIDFDINSSSRCSDALLLQVPMEKKWEEDK